MLIDAYKALVGKEAGVSSWVLIDQRRVDAFAEVTGDFQFIHVDPVRAAGTPLGGTIAHGHLILSMIIPMSVEVMPPFQGARMGMNYGFNKVRFIHPVRTGQRIRGRFAVQDVRERSPGEYQINTSVTIEIEGEERPAMVADWLGLILV
jgi:acyl dehydratase